MKVYTIINQKGGIDKTPIALAIGAGLVLKKYSVLFELYTKSEYRRF